MDQKRLYTFLLKRECDLIQHKFNVPYAHHMSGSWERYIRTVRSVFSPLLTQCGTQLDDEPLCTFITEVEKVVNSRPFTTDDLCDSSVKPLTPNHLLSLKPKLLLPPPGNFRRADVYVRQRWRRVQQLSNEFWHKLSRQYLYFLQT